MSERRRNIWAAVLVTSAGIAAACAGSSNAESDAGTTDGIDGGGDGGATTGDATLGGDGGGSDATKSEVDANGGGRLTVTLALPDGGAASVTVAGPGVAQTLTQTTTLEHLAPGTYTVTAGPGLIAGAVVSTLFDPSVSGTPATVVEGAESKVDVTFKRRPGTGAMWGNATYEGFVYAYTDEQLRAADAGPPSVSLDAGAKLNGPEAIVFDSAGNLWTADNGHNRLMRWNVALLDTTGSPALSGQIDGVTLTDGDSWQSLGDPEGLAFDPSGNLWVASCGNTIAGVLRYTPAQLAAGGAQTPDAILRDAPLDGGVLGDVHTVECLYDIVFDKDGGLWFMNQGGRGGAKRSSIVYYATPSALTGLTHQAPDLVLALDAPAFPTGDRAQGIAFDDKDRLWVGFRTAMFRLAVDKSARGVVIPAFDLSLSSTDGGLGSPTFDNAGNLWVSTGDSIHAVTNATSAVGDAGAIFGVSIPVPTMDALKLRLNPTPAGLPVFPR